MLTMMNKINEDIVIEIEKEQEERGNDDEVDNEQNQWSYCD